MSSTNNGHSPYEPFVIKEGGSITITHELMLLLQRPRRKPSRGGLPFVVILKRCKRGRVALPTTHLSQGFALFLGDGLRHGLEFPFVWVDDKRGSAAAVSPEDIEAYNASSADLEAEDFVPPEVDKF